MTRPKPITDIILLGLILVIMAGVPLGVWAYDRQVWEQKIPTGAKVFTMSGHTELGWLEGRVKGYDVLRLDPKTTQASSPRIVVKKGDLVVFKLTSSDVIHGFSLKDFGIFIEDGIRPGKVTLVSFTADKVGIFTFSCNIICGDQHKKMQGVLIVQA